MSANRCAKPLQQKAKFCLCPFMIAFTCNAHSMILRKLRFTLMGTRSLLHYLQFLQPSFVAATRVLHPTSFIASFIPLNFVSFTGSSIAFAGMVFNLTHKAIRKNTHTASQSYSSFHSIFTPLPHSFTSAGFSPPLPIICVPGGLLWLRVCHVFCILYTFLCYKKNTPKPCV